MSHRHQKRWQLIRKVFAPFLFCLAATLVVGACAGGPANGADENPGAYSGTLVLEGRHVYPSGTVLPGFLLLLDGDVSVEPGARVEGLVFQLGGRLALNGTAGQDVSITGGELVVGPQAEIGGSLRIGAGQADISPQARVAGQVLTGAASGVAPQNLVPERSINQELAWLLPESLALAGLAYLLARWARKPVERVRRAALQHPIVSGAMGLLGAVVGLVLLVVMAYTLILLPVTLLGLLIGFLAIGYGWVGVGDALGGWLAARLVPGRDWTHRRPLLTALGTFAFVVVLNLLTLLPHIGGILGIAASVLALGAVLLTRFGLREFVPDMSL